MKIDYQEKLIELLVLAATAPHEKGYQKCLDLVAKCTEFLTDDEIATATIQAEYILQTLKKLEVNDSIPDDETFIDINNTGGRY